MVLESILLVLVLVDVFVSSKRLGDLDTRMSALERLVFFVGNNHARQNS